MNIMSTILGNALFVSALTGYLSNLLWIIIIALARSGASYARTVTTAWLAGILTAISFAGWLTILSGILVDSYR